MTTAAERAYTNIDKAAEWGEGPWVDEPDKVQWVDETTGLPCLAVRQPNLGHWCGYVAVSDGHPAFEKDYDDVRVPTDDGDEDWPEVHGGLTFASHCQEGRPENEGVCHVPEPDQPDHVWWLGFDCAHSGDVSPYEFKTRNAMFDRYGEYRTLSYVRSQCRKLAEQLGRVPA